MGLLHFCALLIVVYYDCQGYEARKCICVMLSVFRIGLFKCHCSSIGVALMFLNVEVNKFLCILQSAVVFVRRACPLRSVTCL